MNTALNLDPIVSQFDTQQQADEYNQWLTKKVEASLASDKWHSHEDVIAYSAHRRAELLSGLKNAD
ncbi:hypothetical protein [Snodgrassella sp. CFCC 13594]|uniref:type II toxin-antitoxin system RelB family antitoxin n=1 Tax=Snodgrassella sp. CFCC 13594 TaxID=1775559 RepID=UPI00082A1E44|nr:hypothetical protein [Snodgrassella sp. CFCC 13594]